MVVKPIGAADKTSIGLGNVDNTADNVKPVSTPQATAIAAAVASIGPGSISYSTVVPLDSTTGKDMGLHVLSASDNFTIATSPAAVVNGGCVVSIQLSGSFVPTFAVGISLQGDAISAEDGRVYEISFVKRSYGVVAFVTKTAFVADTTKPVIGTPHVENANSSKILLPITEPNSPTIAGTTGDVTLGGTPGGRTVTGIAIVSGNLEITLSAPMTWQTSITVALNAGLVRDFNGNVSLAKSATAMVNNLAMPVPGAPTSLTQTGSIDDTHVPLTWVAPAVDGTHGTPVTYQPQVRTHAGPGSWTNYGGTVTHPTVTANPGGLTASTAYDFQIIAHNATGDGTPSSTLSNVSTIATPTGALSVATLSNANQVLTTLGNVDWRFFNIQADASADDFAAAGGFVAASVTFTNASRAGGGALGYNMSWTDGTNSASASRDAAMALLVTSGGTEGYAEFTPPADLTVRKWFIALAVYVGGAHLTNPVQVTFHLSDSSASDVTKNCAIDDGGFGYAVSMYQATYNAGASGQTLRVRVRNVGGLISDFDVRISAIAYGT